MKKFGARTAAFVLWLLLVPIPFADILTPGGDVLVQYSKDWSGDLPESDDYASTSCRTLPPLAVFRTHWK